MAKIEECLGQVEVGSATNFRNLTIVPLMGKAAEGLPKYLLTSEAIELGLLEVREIDMMGHVPELLVRNRSESMVLLIDGEELVGAKQNRIVNTTILLAAQSNTKIPVSCVERGRWRHVSEHFTPGRHAPAAMRAAKSKAVARNLVASGHANADQGEVWAEVDRYSQASGVHSPTDSMNDIFQKREHDFKSFTEKFQYVAGMSGCVVAINGRFAAVDLFDNPATLEKVWVRLLEGYILDAIVASDSKIAAFSEEMVGKLVADIKACDYIEYQAVGLGKDWRFATGDMSGSALVYETNNVHLCAFPGSSADQEQPEGQQGRIARPSQRRRGHHGPE
jgi:hypothetical protein